MKSKFTLFLILLVSISLSSCGPRISGTWNIQNYQSNAQGGDGVSLSNIGTLSFNKNGSGEKKINYNFLGSTTEEETSFKWKSEDNLITIDDGQESQFNKTWIILEDKKNYQRWRSTDGRNQVQTLVLTR